MLLTDESVALIANTCLLAFTFSPTCGNPSERQISAKRLAPGSHTIFSKPLWLQPQSKLLWPVSSIPLGLTTRISSPWWMLIAVLPPVVHFCETLVAEP